MSKKQTTRVPRGKVCIISGCNKQRKARGLCPACYVGMRTEIELGHETWESLEAKGLALPKGSVRRPKTSLIHKALKQASAK